MSEPRFNLFFILEDPGYVRTQAVAPAIVDALVIWPKPYSIVFRAPCKLRSLNYRQDFWFERRDVRESCLNVLQLLIKLAFGSPGNKKYKAEDDVYTRGQVFDGSEDAGRIQPFIQGL